jgi:translation initiation factor IF-2
MSKVRVYEVAKQLNLDPKAAVGLFQAAGFNDVRNHMSSVDVDAVERVKRHLEKQKGPVVEERIRPGVTKRRAVVKPGAPDAGPPSSPAISSVPSSRASRPSQVSLPDDRESARILEPANGHAAVAAPPSAPASRPRIPAAKESIHDVVEERRSTRDVAPPASVPAPVPSDRPSGKRSLKGHDVEPAPPVSDASAPTERAPVAPEPEVIAAPPVVVPEPPPRVEPVAEVRESPAPPPPVVPRPSTGRGAPACPCRLRSPRPVLPSVADPLARRRVARCMTRGREPRRAPRRAAMSAPEAPSRGAR